MRNRIKVVELIYSSRIMGPAGGAGRFGIELVKNLNKEVFNPVVFSLFDFKPINNSKQDTLTLQDSPSTITGTTWDEEKPYRSFTRALKTLSKQLANKSIDIIHSHSEFGDFAALYLKQNNNVKVIIRTIHNGYPIEWRKRPLRRFLFSYLLFPIYFSNEIGVSQNIVDNLNRRLIARCLKRKATKLNNGIDLTRFEKTKFDQPKVRDSLNVSNEAVVIGSVGRLSEEKGYKYLLDAAAIVVKSLPEVYFVIIGEGRLYDSLVQKTIQLGISDNVILTGARRDIEVLHMEMDLFVSSSLWEGLSTGILESMAAKTPVVATDIPGNNELIKNNRNGLLVPPKNSKKLAETILYALNNPAFTDKYCQASFDMVKQYSIKKISRSHEILYKKALNKYNSLPISL